VQKNANILVGRRMADGLLEVTLKFMSFLRLFAWFIFPQIVQAAQPTSTTLSYPAR